MIEKLSEIIGEAFEKEGLPKELGEVAKSDRPDLCEFQCNGAMSAAKIAKKNPREIAGVIVSHLSDCTEIKSADIAGAGFININVSNDFLIDCLTKTEGDRCGIPKTKDGTVIVDYVGANIAKAMHVGHLRPSIIGDAIKNILNFAGYKALGDVHLGDHGLQMGQIISELEIRHTNWGYFTGNPPQNPPFDYEYLEDIYPKASDACKEDKGRLEKARVATAKLQNGDAGYTALWREFIKLSVVDIKRNLDSLNISPEIWKGESDAAPFIEPLEEELSSKGLLVESDGAMVVPVEEEGDKKPMPPLMYRKSDKSATYATTDAATIYARMREYDDLQEIVYVADARQNLHFEQLFRTMKKCGYSTKFSSIGFGTMNGTDGKPFKTRSGGLPRFDYIIEKTTDKVKARLSEAGINGDAELAKQIMIATLKFADLSNPPKADYVFDIDRMTAFEGKTGPYVLYQAVRAKAILDKSQQNHGKIIVTGEDRPIILRLLELSDAFSASLSSLTPHFLVEHVYNLAQEFSRFYAACHIMSEKDVTIKESRIEIIRLTFHQISLVLRLVGIEIPKKM